MQLIVKGRNIEATAALQGYAEEKLSRLERHFEQISKVEIELIVEKNPRVAKDQTAEVTFFARGLVVRARETSNDMHASIDKVVDKLERQLEKYKGKMYHRITKANNRKNRVGRGEGVKIEGPKIVKVKRFEIKPMTPEEAVMQMNLLDHSFFVFTNSESEELNVVYRRKDGNYGLIEPAATLS